MKPERPIKSTVIVKSLRLLIIVWIALLPGLFVSGQVKFTTVVSSEEVGQKDYLEVEYVVENAKQIDDLTPPTFAGFRIIQGPIQSSGMSIVNGAVSQYKALSFVLQPARTGKFSIGGASATVDGHPMRSNTVVITVHAGGNGAAPNGGGNSLSGAGNSLFPPMNMSPFEPEPRDVDREYILKPGENVKEKIRKNLFVKVQVDKNSCYVGEPIVATYKLYSRLSSESRVTKRPSLNGFSVYDMVDPASDQVSVEKLGGKDYTVHIIRKTQLIPLQAGNIDL
ncbi:MAG: BatD family protein, partial [Bacteroidetes bacterium]|nr:BatD family protein [Bacteroidota bacterium]